MSCKRGEIMKRKVVSLFTGLFMVMSVISGCGKQEAVEAPQEAASTAETSQEAEEVVKKPEINIKGTLEFGWAVDHISDEDFAEMSEILEKEAIKDIANDSRFQRVYGDLNMEVSAWDLLSTGEDNKDYNDYGTIIVTDSGKTKTIFPEVRHGRCPSVDVNYNDNTMWLVGEAISEKGVHAEIPYYFKVDGGNAEMIYVVDPVLAQDYFVQNMSLNVSDEKISFVYDGDSIYDIANTGTIENICIGDHISYGFNRNNDLLIKVTPGVKNVSSDELSYENMPTFVGTVVPVMGSEGVYSDFEIKGLSVLSYNQVELDNPMALDDAISSAILKTNSANFAQGELEAEGHILMDSEEDGAQIKAYILSMFGEYEFENGNFVKCSGTGVIPAVVTFVLNDAKEFTLVSYEEPEDGSNFVPSVKALFPEDLWARCITIEDEDRNELTKLERGYAEEYVSSIGRENAGVGDYADFEYIYDGEYGISDEAGNKLLDALNSNNFIKNCPMWYGDREVIEEGIRYKYSKTYDKTDNKVIFSKNNYDTDEVVESAEYSAKTGELIEK